ncbi:tumor necrosis factor receptor superfamily member 25 isoform X1 [Oenanthe melanoleuca]|uniref:tumor necrosis factor receptor superfamily member 25 isoform X1 n=1 Tax=Oenanthe melanoleuca TaxID=2939378 RepID=UPI0024C12706|nr:tumor necrosis factor receptor superfamily member 25 isoform X1 [Oenanthe melanoleuca]
MKCCCPGVAWVTLAALWLAASESQPPGWRDRAVPQRQPVLVQPLLRLRRHAIPSRCPAGTNWVETARHCCLPCPAGERCPVRVAWHSTPWHSRGIAPGGRAPCHPAVPAGTFLSKPCTVPETLGACSPCPAGTFSTQPNTFSKCQACSECDQHAFQSVLSNCSATSNVQCGCEPGHFRDCTYPRSFACSDFSCQKCQLCTGRLIQRPCSAMQDTLCDSSCKPDFYRDGDECRPCHKSTQDTCGKECQQVCGSNNDQGSGLEYILLGLTGPLFLGALAIYHKRKRLWHGALAGGPLPSAQATTSMAGAAATSWCQFNGRRWDNLCFTQPCSPQGTERATGTAKQSPNHQALLYEQPSDEGEPSAPPEPRGALLQGSQLYAVIDVVPVRRWKEFMRMLELREAEIELVELEVAHIRDQQYEMLKRWCQQTSATLDHVFAALERMELAGCAEALRQSLLVGP